MSIAFLLLSSFLWLAQMQGATDRLPESAIQRVEEVKENAPVLSTEDIRQRLPKGAFVSPNQGALLSTATGIVFRVEQAQSVELILRHPESLDEIYVGRANQTEPDSWSFNWEVSAVPDGRYFITSRITGDLGTYQGDSILVRIEKESEADQKRKEAEKEEILEEVKEKQKEAVVDVKEAVEQLAKEAEKRVVPEDVKQRVEETRKRAIETVELSPELAPPDLTRRGQEISQEVKTIGKEIIESSPREEREQVSQQTAQIEERVSESVDKLEQASLEQVRVELNLEEEIQRREATGVKYQDPKSVPVVRDEAIVIEKVEVVELPDKVLGLRVAGKAEPNTFITLYFFSTPLIVLAKADAQGRWEYTLDRQLEDGQHTVYAAVTNSIGQIKESGEPINFVKRGNQVIRLFEPVEQGALSAVQGLQRSFAVLVVSLIILGLSLAFFIIGVIMRRKAQDIIS